MKKLFLVFLFLQSLSLAQLSNTNFDYMRGDDGYLSFAYNSDLTGDTLIFTAKEDKIQTSTALISKTSYGSGITIAGTNPSFIYVELQSIDTDSLSLSKYYYDIQRINNGDTSTIIIGEINLQPDIGGRYDGANTSALTSSKIALWLVIDGTPQLQVSSRFTTNPTLTISNDTITIIDSDNELSLSGEFESNDKDYSIVSHSLDTLIAVFDNGFTGRTTTIYFEVRLAGYFSDETDLELIEDMSSYLLESAFGDSLANYDLLYASDSTAIRTHSDSKYVSKTALADSNFVLTSEMISGTDSIHYGEDSIVVTHGVGSTPQFVVIQLTSDSFGYRIWVSGINSLTFYVRRNDPVVLDEPTTYIKFKWMAYK